MIPAIPRSAPVTLPNNPVVSAADTRVREPVVARDKGPGVLQVALTMNDDLAMSMSAHRMRRSEVLAESPATSTWIDRVLDEEGPRKLGDAKTALLAQRNPLPRDVRFLLGALFPDPSDQVAVLRALLDDEQLEALHEVLGRTLEALLAEQHADGSRKRVAAGVNVAITARLAAQGGRLSAVLLRDCYRDFVGDLRDPVEQYALWVELFGFAHRQAVVDFMGKALIADLYSLDPSCSADEFGPLLSAVGQLRLLRAGDAVIAREFWNARLMARMGVGEADFARHMLQILRHGTGWEALFDALLARAATLCSPEELSWLVQRFLRALRAIPAQLWKSAKHYADAMEELEELVKAVLTREFQRSHSATRRRIGV